MAGQVGVKAMANRRAALCKASKVDWGAFEGCPGACQASDLRAATAHAIPWRNASSGC